MIGYADNIQVSLAVAHKFAAQASATPGGFFTAEAEGNNVSILGLQTWNGIRALDFLETLPEVDPARMGVTGASGGGTQTMLLCGIDDRPAASFPAVMVSTAMQGGCTCENSSLLRIGTGNIEFAALFAPKPQGMTCADDWTKELSTKGFPELQKLYQLLGKPDCVHLTDTRPHPHNYNHISRVGMETWFGRHLLNLPQAPPEREFAFQTAADLTVWDAAHPAPEAGPVAERAIVQQWLVANQAALQAAPEAAAQGWRVILGRDLTKTGTCTYDANGEKKEYAQFFKVSGEVRDETHHEVVAVTFLYPKNWSHKVALLITAAGPAGLFGADGSPEKSVQQLLDAGVAVATPEPFTPASVAASKKNPRARNPREAAAYTYGYNFPLFSQRVQDLLSVIKMVQTNADYKTEHIYLAAGPGGSGLVAAAALMAGDAISGCVFEEKDFSFAKISDIYDENFLPGSLKYGDMAGLAKLIKTKQSWENLCQ
jgi:hypothetical protein